jgi:hypothetical protein
MASLALQNIKGLGSGLAGSPGALGLGGADDIALDIVKAMKGKGNGR